MKIKGRGQAKILSQEEINLFWTKGFLCARDRTLYQICYYLACRIGEARQLLYSDIFDHQRRVKESIVLRKNITKGKQASRTIPTNPKLASTLYKYIEESVELTNIYQTIGDWDYKSLTCPSVIGYDGSMICPKCGEKELRKAGKSRGKQMFKCKNPDCQHRFLYKTAFLEHPELKKRVKELGVNNSTSYGFLFLNPENPYLFPGFNGKGYIGRTTAKDIFTKAAKRINVVGASTHSWRRTALTLMHQEGVILRVIQSISGHVRLKNLQKYLEVTPEEVAEAIYKLP